MPLSWDEAYPGETIVASYIMGVGPLGFRQGDVLVEEGSDDVPADSRPVRAIVTDGQISVSEAPSDPNDVLRLGDAETALVHALLSATHSDAQAAAVERGGLIVGRGASPNTKWSLLSPSPPESGLNVLAIGPEESEPSWQAAAFAPTLHGIVSAHHALDTTVGQVTRGAVLVAQGETPKWSVFEMPSPAEGCPRYLGAESGELEPGYKALLDTQAPAAITAAAQGSAGSETVAARRDHVHASPEVWPPAEHDHSSHTNLNTSSYYHLTESNHTDLTDGGETTLHTHPAAQPAAHQLDGELHTVAGLTPGHFLKAASASSFGFAAHGLTYSDVGAEASGAVATHAALTTGVHGAGAATILHTGNASWQTLTGGEATTLHKHDHGNLDGLGDHDHAIYARLAQAETISDGWTFDGAKSVGGTAYALMAYTSGFAQHPKWAVDTGGGMWLGAGGGAAPDVYLVRSSANELYLGGSFLSEVDSNWLRTWTLRNKAAGGARAAGLILTTSSTPGSELIGIGIDQSGAFNGIVNLSGLDFVVSGPSSRADITINYGTGNVKLGGDLLVDGGNIGITADSDLLSLAADALTVAGAAVVTSLNVNTSGASSGEIKATTLTLSGAASGTSSTWTGGLNVGSATGAGTGIVKAWSSTNGLSRHSFVNSSTGANRRMDLQIGTGSTGSEALYIGVDQATYGAYILNYSGKNFMIGNSSVAKLTLNASTGNVTLANDLYVDGGNIGLTADTDLLGLASGALTVRGTIQPTSAGGYKSSDGSTGWTGTITAADLAGGKTITVKDGIMTDLS